MRIELVEELPEKKVKLVALRNEPMEEMVESTKEAMGLADGIIGLPEEAPEVYRIRLAEDSIGLPEEALLVDGDIAELVEDLLEPI